MLDGIRVLDLTEDVAGPFAGRLLAGFGAEVIKVERPGCGDPARYRTPWDDLPPDENPAPRFLAMNAGKRGITLDLRCERGRDLFARLVAHVDVVLEDADGHGRAPLSYQELARLKPALVLASASSYGADSDLPHHPSLLAYARSGMLYVTGQGDEKPVQTPEAATHLAGVLLASGTIAALFQAMLSGEGDHVDVSAAEAALSVFFPQLARYAYQGIVGGRSAPWAIRPVADGWIYPNLSVLRSVARSQTPEAVAAYLQLPQIADLSFRQEHPAEWDELVTARLLTLKRYEAMHSAQAAGLVWSVVQDPAEILACEHLGARGFFDAIEDPRAGALRYPANPALPTGEARPALLPAPLLGQHNQAVYGGLLGMSDGELAALARERVI
jgi:crotonobetainyl-CoA:carnitine CoA-transferase CaiB-like acyl-CoA transferase